MCPTQWCYSVSNTSVFLKRQLILKTKKLLESTYWLVLCALFFLSTVLDSVGRTKWLSSGLLLTEATLPGFSHPHTNAFFVTPGAEWIPGENKKQRDPRVWKGGPKRR